MRVIDFFELVKRMMKFGLLIPIQPYHMIQSKLNKRYYWPGSKNDVSEYISQCHICSMVKKGKTITPLVQNRPVLPQRFSQLEIDVVGPLPSSENMRYLLTILCRTSRMVDAIPMPEATSANCANAFIRHWVKHWGLPTHAKSDNGNTFIANLWRDLHAKLGTIISYCFHQ